MAVEASSSEVHENRHGITTNWLITGSLATLSFGFYGLFSKLSTFQQPILSNLIIYGTVAICGITLVAAKKGTSLSKEALLSGVFANIAALTMQSLLVKNQILVVFSFVSFASVIFFLIVVVIDKPELSSKQIIVASIGTLVSAVGLFIASTSTAGGIGYVLKSTVNPDFIIIASLIPMGFGLWSYFSFVAIKKKGVNVSTAFSNCSFGSALVALTCYLFFDQSLPATRFSDLEHVFPIFAGLSVSVGVILALQSFEMTSGKSRIEETVVAILANAEIIPLIFLSYFILGEFTIEGFVGALTVFLGLSILNSARVR